MIMVRRRHLAQIQFCGPGIRLWFERHGWDYSDFLKNGIPVEKVEACGDEFALRAAKRARQEAANG